MNRKVLFILINVLTSFITFGKSFLFMRYLPDSGLGVLMLFNSVIALFGLFQIGLFNGGYRILSIDANNKNYTDVNNTNFTYVILLTGILIIFSSIYFSFYRGDYVLTIFAIIAGGFSLLKNWSSNILVSRRRLREINFFNLSSALISVGFASSIFYIGEIGALLAIASLPISFVLLFFVIVKDFRPTSLTLNFYQIRAMIAFGFVPYLSGITVILNNQIDRFIIAQRLSLEELGQLYLSSIFLHAFSLLPVNLNQLFGPDAINSYSKGDLKRTRLIAGRFFFILLAYSVVALLAVVLIGKPVVSFLFPDKLGQLQFLYILLPGFICLVLAKPFAFYLYAALNLRAIFYSNLFSLSSYLLALVLLIFIDNFTLYNVTYAKSIQSAVVLVFMITLVAFNYSRINSFYYINKNKYSNSL
jgi:O-antigen/teichoic acid export membrane protein